MKQRALTLSGLLIASAAGLVAALVLVVMAVGQLIDSAQYEGGFDADPVTNRGRAAAYIVLAVIIAGGSLAVLAWRARRRSDEVQS